MEFSFKHLPGSQIDLSVTLDAQEFMPYFETAMERAVGLVELKGFRKGTASRELAERAVDREKVFGEAVERAVRNTLDEVKEEQGWMLVDTPKVEVGEASKDKPFDSAPFDTAQGKQGREVGLSYRATLTIFPEVKLGDYRKIAKRVRLERKPVAVSPEEIEKSLSWLQESRAIEVRAEREAREGDLVEADVDAATDGKPIPGARLKRDRFVLGRSRFVPGFDSNLAGRRAGEAFSFTLTAPADYWEESLRGKEIVFTVRIHVVYDRTLPALDDALAAGLGPKFKTLAEVRESIREGITEERGARETERLRLKTLTEIAAASEVDIPSIMRERALDAMVAAARHHHGKIGKSEAELRAELLPRARERLGRELALQAIAKREKLEPTPEEVEAELKAQDPRAHRGIDASRAYDYSYGVVQSKKIFSFLDALK